MHTYVYCGTIHNSKDWNKLGAGGVFQAQSGHGDLLHSGGLGAGTPRPLSSRVSGALGGVDVLRQGLPRGVDHRGEGGGVVDRHFGQLAAVDFDARQVESLDEAVVGHPLGAHGRVDAGDPQLAELALAGLAVAVVVDERMGDLLLGLAVEPGALAPVARGPFEGGAALLRCVDCALDSCHGLLLLLPAFSGPAGT